MSRSKKGAKGPGYEYWSRRPFNRAGGLPGKALKKRTHKAERAVPVVVEWADVIEEKRQFLWVASGK